MKPKKVVKQGKKAVKTGVKRSGVQKTRGRDVNEDILLHTLMDNLSDCHVFIKDRKSRFVTTNAFHLKSLGVKSLKSVVGRTDFDFFPKDLAQQYYDDEQMVIRTGQALIDRDERMVDTKGREHWLLTTKTPLRGSDGIITGIVGVSRDITGRKRAEDELVAKRTAELEHLNQQLHEEIAERGRTEERLQEEHSRLRALMENLPGCHIFIKDRKSRFVATNTSHLRVLGVKKVQDVEGRTDFDFFPKEYAKRYFDDEQKLMQAGSPLLNLEEPFVDHDGRAGWLLTTKVPLKNALGEVTGLVGMSIDISERRRASDALKEERSLLRTLIDNLPHAVYVKDTQSRFVIVNSLVNRILNTSQTNIIGKSDFDFFSKDQATQFYNDEQQVMKTGQPIINKNESVPDEKGNTTSLLTTTVPLKDHAGTIVGVLGISVDISERKKEDDRRRLLEEQLRQAEKMKAIGHLAGGVAHDFNNQLVAIMGSADMIRTWPDDKEGVAQHAEMILTASKRAADLTGKLLAFARKGRYQFVPVNMHKLIGEVVSLLERSIDKRIKVLQKLRANPSMVMGDPTQLQNALLNIAINARDAMMHEGEIVFSTEIVNLDKDYCRHHPHEIAPGRYVQIGIADTGVGMDEETMKHIFEPFFTTKKEGEGTGMGLAAVYGTVRNHQGTVSFTSELGYGTKFKVCLPLAEEEEEKEEIAQGGEAVSGVESILVVDDEEVVRATVTAILRKLGYRVTTCSDGEEAVEFYKTGWREVDLVIIDMVMPQMGGLDAFIAMKAINPDVKAILSTGYSIAGEAQRIMEEGVRGFIQKPFQVALLSRTIAEVLNKQDPRA